MVRNIRGPVAVVSIAGLYRTGKSFLLNQLLRRPDGFAVGATVNACTKGLWIWGDAEETDGLSVIFMDTEGLGSTQRSSTQDTRIFSLALLLSSYFIYNSRGVIDGRALDDLSLVINLTKFIQVKAQKEEDGSGLYEFFPSFLWVVRDFTLQLQEAGKKISSRQYLENALKQQGTFSEDSQTKNHVRHILSKFFVDRDCVTMVRPAADEEMLRHLSDHMDQLRPEFSKQVEILRTKVITNAKPKQLMGKVLNGPMLVHLAEAYVQALNDGGTPVISSAWDRVVDAQCQAGMDKARQAFAATLSAAIDTSAVADVAKVCAADAAATERAEAAAAEQRTFGSAAESKGAEEEAEVDAHLLPRDEEELRCGALAAAEAAARAAFAEETVSGESGGEEYAAQLRDMAVTEWRALRAANATASTAFCSRLLRALYVEMVDAHDGHIGGTAAAKRASTVGEEGDEEIRAEIAAAAAAAEAEESAAATAAAGSGGGGGSKKKKKGKKKRKGEAAAVAAAETVEAEGTEGGEVEEEEEGGEEEEGSGAAATASAVEAAVSAVTAVEAGQKKAEQMELDASTLQLALLNYRSALTAMTERYRRLARGPAAARTLNDFFASTVMSRMMEWAQGVMQRFKAINELLLKEAGEARQEAALAAGRLAAQEESSTAQKQAYDEQLSASAERLAEEKMRLREAIDNKQNELERTLATMEALSNTHQEALQRQDEQLRLAREQKDKLEGRVDLERDRRENDLKGVNRELLESERTFHSEEKNLMKVQQDLMGTVLDLERQMGQQANKAMEEKYKLQVEHREALEAERRLAAEAVEQAKQDAQKNLDRIQGEMVEEYRQLDIELTKAKDKISRLQAQLLSSQGSKRKNTFFGRASNPMPPQLDTPPTPTGAKHFPTESVQWEGGGAQGPKKDDNLCGTQ